MLDLLHKELLSRGALSGPLPPIIDRIVEAIPFQTIPLRMKQTIAISEIMLFASQFRRNIAHWDGASVPINTVGFVITGSGQNKDSSINAARKCFATGYSLIEAKRLAIAKQKAIREAHDCGDDNPNDWETYKKYYRAPNPIFVAPSTPEGFIQHLNDLDSDGLGAGFCVSSEFGAELANSPLIVENLKVLSELYDLGNKEVKALKSRENQSKEIKGLPVSALFVGSPANILYDETVKRRFRVEFSTKLARRSWFCYLPQTIPEPSYPSVSAMIEAEKAIEDRAIASRLRVADGISILTNENLAHLGDPLSVEPDVRELFIIYKRYNTEKAATIPKLYPLSEIVRKHLQWKALKLSGAFAIFDRSSTITVNHYIQAIRFCEMLDNDMQLFEAELVKEQYEVFSDYMRSISENGKSSISVHNLRKMGFISGTGAIEPKLRELCHLAASYDPQGIYSSAGNSFITYEAVVPVQALGVSYLPIDVSPLDKSDMSKEDRDMVKASIAHKVAKSPMTYSLTTFAGLGDMLKRSFAFSPFEFKGGHRTKDTLVPTTKWLVFDIDTSTITAEECHLVLQDFNHHIALTSDPTNVFKFHVLLELDSPVSLSPTEWKFFYQSVARYLGLQADILPQSQIFYSYEGRQVFSNTSGSAVEVRDHVMLAKDHALSKPVEDKPLTTPQKRAMLSDELTTFNNAFEAPDGRGSIELMKAAYYAKYLGMSRDEVIALVRRINNYWLYPMPEARLQQTIISQILRWPQ